LTEKFNIIYKSVNEDQYQQLPPIFQSIRVILVPGLFTNQYPGYMGCHLRYFTKLGIEHHKIPLNTSASVSTNAEAICEFLLKFDDTKKFVIIGHSKGGVDSTAAITLNPEKLIPKIAGMILVQSPYAGTPLAEDVTHRSDFFSFLKSAFGRLNIDPNALEDLSYTKRMEFFANKEYPSKHIPTLSLISFTESRKSPMYPLIKHIKNDYNIFSDGLVTSCDAKVPGGSFVLLEGIDHGGTVFGIGHHGIGSGQYVPQFLFLSALKLILQV